MGIHVLSDCKCFLFARLEPKILPTRITQQIENDKKYNKHWWI